MAAGVMTKLLAVTDMARVILESEARRMAKLADRLVG
jgi:hypothetical protein